MHILFLAHMWCPVHNAGGETTAHSAMREMVRRGHTVDVICRPQSNQEGGKFEDYTFEGVTVLKCPTVNEQQWIEAKTKELNPDLLITHLDLTTHAMQLSLDVRKPLAHWVHNTMSFNVFKVTENKCQLAIFNSHWVSEFHNWKGAQIVVHPTVEPERYRCERGEKVTLVNPTPGKGADTFYQLAKRLPQYEFLTVKSVYGEQIAPPNINPDNWPNVEFLEHTPDIREVFRKTKILLMPSEYESYGRVAVEAACAGIPTIAHPTPGLKEALGDAGIFCDRNDIPAWQAEIDKLFSNDIYYKKRSDLALELANSLDPQSEFDRLENALLVTSERWKQREADMQEKMWTSDRRLYRNAQGQITSDYSEAVSLCCGVGGQIPEADAIRLGLVPGSAVVVTPDPVDPDVQWAKDEHAKAVATDAKALDAPEENKMVEAPAENKHKGGRKKKAA